MNSEQAAPMLRNQITVRKYYILLFALFFVSYAYFFQGGGWNQNSKICLTRSIIHHGSFTIDSCREDTPEMIFANTGDYAFYNGHYYSNKSPGHAFLAVPSFAIAEYIFSHLFPENPELQIRLSAYISTVCTTVLCSTLLCLMLFRFFLVYFHVGVSKSLLLTLCFGFGTLAFSYSTTFYTHMLSAFFLFLAFTLLLNVRTGNTVAPEAVSLVCRCFNRHGRAGRTIRNIWLWGSFPVYACLSTA